ncbi:MAG: 4Fe-4S binding protein [Candidatus Helarchaeota archaeon]|nr:4Fe-4S binding protein [Candidatus Helarchaeota archaeon]
MKIELSEISERVGDPGDFLSVDHEKCVGCGNCVKICIVNIWRMRGGLAYIADDYKEKCLECGGCWQVCDAEAVNFKYPAGGTGVVYKKG